MIFRILFLAMVCLCMTMALTGSLLAADSPADLAWDVITANRSAGKPVSTGVSANMEHFDTEILDNYESLTETGPVTGVANHGIDVAFHEYKDRDGITFEVRQCHTGWMLYVPQVGSDDADDQHIIQSVLELAKKRLGSIVDLNSLHRDGSVAGSRLYQTKTPLPDYVHGAKGTLLVLQYKSVIGLFLGKSVDAREDSPQHFITLSRAENADWFNPAPIPGKGGAPLR